jgi:hypothetical protein
MRTKKYSSKLMFLGAVILLIVACNMPAPSPQIPANPPVVTQTEPPPLASTRPPAISPARTFTSRPSTIIPTLTFTPLPPMPDFNEILTFGGAGAGDWGCAGTQYPSVPNAINMLESFGQNVFLCVFARGIDITKPMTISLSQIGGNATTLVSQNLMFDRNGEAILWEQSLQNGIITEWKADGSVFFTVVVWWPAALSSGSWRVTVYQEGGFRASTDIPILKVSGKAHLDAMDPYARQAVLPGAHWAGGHSVHLNGNGNVDVYGVDYPPNTPVYLILYRASKLVQKEVVISDSTGTISAELSGSFGPNQSYILYGITDSKTKLDGTNFITCHDALKTVAGAACDDFTISPAIVRSSCSGAPLQRMIVNARGHVCTQSDSVRVRSGPARSSSTLFQLKPNTIFTVIGGPACSDNWSWWNIRMSDGTTGWVSEGGDDVDQYFICPG